MADGLSDLEEEDKMEDDQMAEDQEAVEIMKQSQLQARR